jgi:hypothetical protein
MARRSAEQRRRRRLAAAADFIGAARPVVIVATVDIAIVRPDEPAPAEALPEGLSEYDRRILEALNDRPRRARVVPSLFSATEQTCRLFTK